MLSYTKLLLGSGDTVVRITEEFLPSWHRHLEKAGFEQEMLATQKVNVRWNVFQGKLTWAGL